MWSKENECRNSAGNAVETWIVPSTRSTLDLPKLLVRCILLKDLMNGRILAILAVTLLMAGCGSGGQEEPCKGIDCGKHGICDPDTGTCNCTDGWTGFECELAPAPMITSIPLECSATWCDCLQIYQGTFTYTGPVIEITGTCSVTGGSTPGTITDIDYSNGSGTYIYDPSPNGGGQIETIELGIMGLGGTDSDDFSHQLR
jgi:hypothetical protein